MSKNVQDDKPARGKEADAWMKDETAAQEVRYKAIVDEIDGIEDERAEWIDEFLRLIQTSGYYMTGDQKRLIPDEEMPTKPKRADAMRVIW